MKSKLISCNIYNIFSKYGNSSCRNKNSFVFLLLELFIFCHVEPMVKIKVMFLDGLKIRVWVLLIKKVPLHISFKRDKVLQVLYLISVARYILDCEFGPQSPSESY